MYREERRPERECFVSNTPEGKGIARRYIVEYTNEKNAQFSDRKRRN